jgi:hypothetical protein
MPSTNGRKLASRSQTPHMSVMTRRADKSSRTTIEAVAEQPVVYRGIKIEPIGAKRSRAAKTLLKALRDKVKQPQLAD